MMNPTTRALVGLAVVGVAALLVGVVVAYLPADGPVGFSGRLGEATGPAVIGPREGAPASLPERRPREATPVSPRPFDPASALATVRALEGFGVRAGGSEAEVRAAEYLKSRLVGLGLAARIEEFPLPGGLTSRNVVARIEGSSDAVLVIGAHYDSKPPSAGANDNGSGCGVVLEVASLLVGEPHVPTVEIVFFGSEEIIGGDPDAHHFGSRFRVAQMSAEDRALTAGMLSVDMIGYGPDFHSRTRGIGSQLLSDLVLARARALGIPMTFKRDTSKTGLSDHEAYEDAGIPVSCVSRRTDPAYHTERDTTDHLSSAHVATAGRLVMDLVRAMDDRRLGELLGVNGSARR